MKRYFYNPKAVALAAASLLLLSFTLPLAFDEVSEAQLPLDKLTNNSMDIEAADLDKDGDTDLVIAMEFRPNVLLLNDGTGNMAYATVGRLPRKYHDSEDIALGDFDRDGDTDIIFVSEDDQVHEYYLNDGKAYFTDASERLPFRSICNAVEAADLDKDGDLDLVLGNAGQDLFLLNDGKGNFTDATAARLPVESQVTQDVQSGDIDRDGDLDLVIGNEDGNRIYLNNGKGFFTDGTEGRLPPASEETRKVDLADIDKDGDLDLFFSNVDFTKTKNPANRLLVNDGKGRFVDETEKRFKAANDLFTGDVSFADLDGDRDLDLVVANLGGPVQVLENEGKGVFTDRSASVFPAPVTGDAISVEVVDLNRDRKPELYIGMFRGGDRLFRIR